MAFHFDGILIAAATMLIIGVFHPIVIRAEYHFGCKIWPAFLGAGLVFLTASLFTDGMVPGAILAVTGAACLWSIRELFEQRERVRKGWWPANPDRKD